MEEPDLELVGRYRELYPVFRVAYPTLKPLFQWLTSVGPAGDYPAGLWSVGGVLSDSLGSILVDPEFRFDGIYTGFGDRSVGRTLTNDVSNIMTTTSLMHRQITLPTLA